MTTRQPFIAFLGLLLFMLAACGKAASSTDPRTEAPLVRAGLVERSVQAERSFTGIVAARVESDLGFRVPGKVLERLVDTGQTVKLGQPLMRIDPTDLRLALRAHEEAVAAARARARQTAEDEVRYRNLVAIRAVSASEYDQARAAAESARADLNAAEARADVARNETGYAVLLADADGVMVETLAEPGQVVAAGQTIMKLARTDDREVVISIPENRLSELSAATEIDISLWADPSKIYKGKLRELSPSADPVTRTYAAKISVRNADAAIKLGMTANVYLRGVQRSAAIMLPATALFQDNGHAAVWIVDKTNSQVKLVPVEVGEYVEDRVGILAGLAPGDTVVRAGVHKLFAGEKVRTHEEPAQEAAK